MNTWLQRLREDVRPQLHLALPIMGAQLSQTGMAVVDTMMTGHYDAADLAAVSVGSSLWLPVYLLIAGTLLAITPRVAHADGAGDPGRLRGYLGSALVLAALLGVAGAVLLLAAGALLPALGVPMEIAGLATRYLAGVALGFPALAIYHVFRAVSEGLQRTRAVLWVGLIALALNIPANALLIFGAGPVPALGAFGCGLATALAFWAMALAMAAYVIASPACAAVGRFWQGIAPAWSHARDVLVIGLPIGLAIFFEVTLFAAIAVLVAGFGETVVAAHQIALNYASLTFMLPLGLALALTVRVGYARGRGTPELARRWAASGMVLAVITGLLLALLMLLTAGVVVRLYTPDPAIRELAASLILLAAVFQLSDTLQVNAGNALRGYEDTRAIMLITLPAYWIVGLGSGVLLAHGIGPLPALGVHGFWIGLLVGLSTAAGLLGARLRWIAHRACGEAAAGQTASRSVTAA
ncbi:MATE family efflux transporter [Sediminicurvatus halobius]|uniref:Multidrug-efflux transporter n=1 Tax=Sediminicurvatus halobius TaxID=2182432 RepID=A0A2U2N8S9_9GAMM|nr:MATE family efflux transporter [Spiribacter halobius]PWG65492.1 MATE family efflux transporter [Spiribacter halobius]UEX76516.1 MATE family efflux transporter [Spiribacter halobius]